MNQNNNEFALLNFKRTLRHEGDIEGTQEFQKIVFYEMFQDGKYENGTTLEELLEVGIERLQNLNQRFSCRENSIAITKMQEALMWLNKRTEDRIERGVEGKHLA